MAASTVVYTIYAKKQWRVMEGQLRELKNSGKQTDDLICLYQQQVANLSQQATDTHALAISAGEQAGATKVQADRTREIAEHALAQAKATNALVLETNRLATSTDISAKAAESAAKTASDELEIGERPWVGVDVKVSGPFNYKTSGMDLTSRFTFHNSGRSPAIGLYMAPELLPVQPDNLAAEEEQLCKRAVSYASRNPSATDAVFPGVDTSNEEQLETGSDNVADAFKNKGYANPVLIVCVAYRSAFSDKYYETGRTFGLATITPPGLNLKLGENKTFAPSNLILVPYGLGSSFAK